MDRPLHPDDIVALRANEKLLAVVERTHSDVDTHDPYPGRRDTEIIKRHKDISKAAYAKFMKTGVPPKGTVMIRWQHKPATELLHETKLVLLDHSLLIGDVVRKDARDAMSGVVLNTFTKCTLQPICDLNLAPDHRLKGLLSPMDARSDVTESHRPEELVDIPACELKYAESITEEDLVIYKDWVGRVEEITVMLRLKLCDNSVVEISHHLAKHMSGELAPFYVGDIAKTKKGTLRTGRWIFGAYNPNTPPVGTVVDTRNVAVDVSWFHPKVGSGLLHEPPERLERDELESSRFKVYDRTRRPASADAVSRTDTVSNSEIDVRLGLRVRFKDLPAACAKYDGSSTAGKLARIDRRETLGFDINVFDVIKFWTEVTVQWQDLTITRERSTDLVPDPSIDDEHAAWPGEIAHTLLMAPQGNVEGVERSPRKVGVVQAVNALERMAKVKWCEGASVVYSLGTDTEAVYKALVSGVVGAAGGEEEEISLYDVEAPAELNVRRGDVVLISNFRWKDGQEPVTDSAEVDWVGEIVDTALDGTLTVRLGAASETRDVVLRREDMFVAVRSDGTGEVDDEWWEGDSDMDGELDAALDSDDMASHVPGDAQGLWSDEQASDMEEDSEEEDEDSDDAVEARYEDENGEPLDEADVENEEWESDDDDADEDEEMVDAPAQTPLTSPSATPSDTSKPRETVTPTANDTAGASLGGLEAHPEAPEPYLILDTPVPTSHHYASELPSESPTHTKRVAKEHKILRSALPTGVYVRTWASRLDLLRVLFVGPTETPYADAPFLIDVHLPSSFPTQPPRAFFHSWTADVGGSGRVNPNLYEDGKICLSLLGTWEAGARGEGWSAARSTVLQVLVSLLGLVLVREPYFNEAGYEPLAGLESSRRPSALYNERTFLRARAFTIAAVERLGVQREGLAGMEDVVGWLFKDARGPKLLERNATAVREVLGRSEVGGEEADGVKVMSKGACIPLRRVLERLDKL